MNRDELIEFGFKRVVEELQEIRGEIVVLRSEVNGVAADLQRVKSAAQSISSVTAKIEHNTFVGDDALISIENKVEAIKADTLTTGLNVIRITQDLQRGIKADESGLEGVQPKLPGGTDSER